MPFSWDSRPTKSTDGEPDGGPVLFPGSSTPWGLTLILAAGSPPATSFALRKREGAMNTSTSFAHVSRARASAIVEAATAEATVESR